MVVAVVVVMVVVVVVVVVMVVVVVVVAVALVVVVRASPRCVFSLMCFCSPLRSEHRVAGVQWPIEVHCVHQSAYDASRFGVFGLLFQVRPPPTPLDK